MKFYDCKTAPSPRRVRIFIAEKGLELETVQVDLGSGEQFSDECDQPGLRRTSS
jgi:glutathione S-transferase